MRDIPFLFGIASLGNKIDNLSYPSFSCLFRSDKIKIFSSSTSWYTNHLNHEGQFLVLKGAIYSPFHISFSTNSRDDLLQLMEKSPSEIDGNFVLVRATRDSVSIISDKFGSRLLLYCINNNRLFFSTNLYGLKVLLENEFPSIDERSLIHYYHFGFTESERTLLNGVSKLPAGNILSVKNGEISRKSYFNLLELKGKNNFRQISEDRLAQIINEKLSHSIERRSSLHSVLPVAVSGGVDSGFIIKKLIEINKEVAGYNLSYKGFYNEHDRIDDISKKFDIGIKKIVVDTDDLIQSLEESNSVSSEPIRFNDAAMRLLAIETKKDGFETLWDGDGADRLFFGMNRQLKYIKLQKLYHALTKYKLLPLAKFPLSLIKKPELVKLRTLINNWENNILPYPERKMLSFYDEEIERNIYEKYVKKHREEYQSFFKSYDLIDYFTYQSIIMCPEMFFYPPSELQSAIGLMPVSPYWDEEVVKMSLNIPKDLKIKDGYTKYILRKAAALNGDTKYWMKPKIGLQSAFQFVIQNEKGRTWKDKYVKRSFGSNEYSIIEDHLRGNKVDLDRLLFLEIWKEKNGID